MKGCAGWHARRADSAAKTWPGPVRSGAASVPESDPLFRKYLSSMNETGAVKLLGAVQHYEWGGFEFIPGLLGADNRAKRPYGELWIGAHPKAPATAETAEGAVALDKLIARAPERMLGPDVSVRYGGTLPYLFKVLDVAGMLSIQAHPTIAQARDGFARENAAGIALGAPQRNYKDENHKPEAAVALTEFWMLHGFRPLEQIAVTLESVPELHELMPGFSARLQSAGQRGDARAALLRELYEAAMTMPQARVDAMLGVLTQRLAAHPPADKDTADYWAARAAQAYPPRDGHYDRGIFSIYLLNLVHLHPGEATFQPAGLLHAYLEGVNVEVMANSDNVLRGGLTPKHVDVPELLRVLSFSDGLPEVLEGAPGGIGERVYHTPCAEFEVSRIALEPGERYEHRAQGPDSLIVLEGAATLTAGGRDLALGRGGIAFVPDGIQYALQPAGAPVVAFKAAVPVR
jgi:mannose-6-phosphate isomerase